MRIVTVRRISQVFFLVLFLWFTLVTTFGERWHELRGWPVNWLLELDPLVGLGTVLTTGTLYAGLLWAVATLVLTAVLGRFFCGWLCPFGTLHQFFGWLGRLLGTRHARNRYHPAQSVKYYVLLFLLVAAAGDLLVLGSRASQSVKLAWLIPLFVLTAYGVAAVARRLRRPRRTGLLVGIVLFAWLAAGRILPGDLTISASLLTGFLDPIPLIYRSVTLVYLPLVDHSAGLVFAAPRYYDGAWLIGTIFLAALLLNLVIPRFYCRFVCPLGALLAVVSRNAVWRMAKTESPCSNCKRCDSYCEGACDPSGRIRTAECVLCMNCMTDCEDSVMTYRTEPSAEGERPLPDVSRRGLLASLASGFVAVPLLRVGGNLGPDWNPGLVRPPGSLPEPDFLDRCLRCGQCMRICPTNVLQPAGADRGLEALWTPALNNRIGTSGCQLNCVACGHICPTGSIRPFTLDEKLGLNRFAEQGLIRMGTAFVDRGRCLPWAMDRPCIVCQENCPVSPKAIYLREHYETIRDGIGRVRLADGDTVVLEDRVLEVGRFGTGDHYCLSGASPVRRRIGDNTTDALKLDAGDWGPPPAPGTPVRIQVRLELPYVDPALCNGCGICEHECPVSGKRAIRVTAENETRSRDRSLLPGGR